MISLTFDDALDQHLDHAIPLLEQYGLRGTFYVHLSAPALSRRLADWQGVAQAGHELGNHTIFHPAVASKSWVRAGNALEAYTLDRMRLEIEVANHWLDALDGGRPRSFAYPCSNPWLGDYGVICRGLFRMGLRNTRWPGLVERRGLDVDSSRQSYVGVVRDIFVAARGGGLLLEERCTADHVQDPFMLPSAAVEQQHDFEAMRGFVERSLAAGGWPILQFHGIGGGHHMDCRPEAFETMVAWLADKHGERVVSVAVGAQARFGVGGLDSANGACGA